MLQSVNFTTEKVSDVFILTLTKHIFLLTENFSLVVHILPKSKQIAHGDNPSEIVESVEKGYFASPSGNIYNRHGDLMVGSVDHCGYRHTILNRKNRNVHRVIA